MSHVDLHSVSLVQVANFSVLVSLCFQVKLESNFASVVFAIMVLEGLGRSLDPEVDILKAAKPLLV